ncbi:Methylenetetrahydrofolate reductase 1 [Smittium mucronatum]|uniref:Methylenetetrahydrofolate reductase 1 n=1 Tax=Smittium mucronatum TaxID=133383 RepID=A0A1R0H992_9FUNG|nr:Methylenetetrahydrofolate reductase 1 [Smittium mucronatum]
MKLIDKMKANIDEGNVFFSFEFFPPKTPQGLANLCDRLTRMKAWNPLFSTVTWCTGSSPSNQCLEFSSNLHKELGMNTVMHLACTNMSKASINSTLKDAKNVGIQSILVLRGDEPSDVVDRWPVTEGSSGNFKYASDLVEYIKSIPEYSDYFTIGVAGFPEGYISEKTDQDQTSDQNDELYWLSHKVNKGADFILSQVFYSTQKFMDWYKKCRDYGITVPIIPTLLPIQTFGSFKRIVNLTKISVPSSLEDRIDRVKNDDLLVKQIGIDYCCHQINQLIDECNVPGIHFSTLNLENSIHAILSRTGLLKPLNTNPSSNPSGATSQAVSRIGDSSATWDEYPNSRWGDARSPAFFNESSYTQINKISSLQISQWGIPKSLSHLNDLFSKYCKDEISSLPWTSDNINSRNSDFGKEVLAMLPNFGIWPLASQRAIDGITSNDPELGWGPANGYVYQRSFIEFFATEAIASKILKLLENSTDYSYYLSKQDPITNEPHIISNAVVSENIQSTALCWGVFPSSPVIQSALIDKLNFEYWSKEAIQLWRVWADQLGVVDNDSKKFVDSVADSIWLINIIGNDYKRPDQLLQMLKEEFCA